MSNECPEVRSLIHVLVSKVECCMESLKGQDIGMALYGLQGMSNSCSEVRTLFGVLSLKIQTSQHPMKILEIGNALYGLQGMKNSTELKPILNHLYDRYIELFSSPYEKLGLDSVPRFHLESLSLALTFILPIILDGI